MYLAGMDSLDFCTPAIANGAYRGHGLNPCSPLLMEYYIALEVYVNRVYFREVPLKFMPQQGHCRLLIKFTYECNEKVTTM